MVEVGEEVSCRRYFGHWATLTEVIVYCNCSSDRQRLAR